MAVPFFTFLIILSIATWLVGFWLLLTVSMREINPEAVKRTNRMFFAVAGLQFLQLACVAATIQMLLRDPWLLDLNPLDRLAQINLYWYVPCGVASIVIAGFRGRRTSQFHRLLPSMSTLAAVMILGVCHGYYVFEILLGEQMTEYTWWM